MSEGSKAPEHELALRCRGGSSNEEDWQEFYESLYGFVRSIAYRAAKGRFNEIDDMIQEAFTRVFQVMPEWNPERATIRTYLRPIVSHAVVDYLRHGRYVAARTVRLDDELRAFRVRAAQDPELLERVALELVDHLGDPVKVGIIGAILRDGEVKEICSEFGVKPHQVYSARVWLKRKLKEWSHHLPAG